MPEPPGAPDDNAPIFDLDGGRACLDFANTFTSSGEHLSSYADLVAFGAQSNLITPDDADWLRAEAGAQLSVAQAVLERARRLRDALQAIFRRIAAGERPLETDVRVLNADLADSLSHACVQPSDGGETYQWGWRDRSLEAPIWPITRSAADVLVSEQDRPLVRECGAGSCAWLFLDTSKNRSRQWCSMRSCGNREKARRHYQRLRASRDASA